MIAYHFPPLAGSSGIQRTLRFVQHLPALGWQPLVLGADPRAFDKTSNDLLADVPAGTVVRRAFALDTARHLQVGGRYLGLMARPDRWISWKFDGIRQGLRLIREFKPDVIWSTYPIATAHVIASALHHKTGIPWIADFRDPMAQDDYPADLQTRQHYQAIEADAAAHARYCVFTTPSAAAVYRQRYPAAADRMVVVENGYDEESFAAVPRSSSPPVLAGNRPLVMLHSGIVYGWERDPTQLFMALGRLKTAGVLGPADLRIRFRASVNDELLSALAKSHGAYDFLELCPAIPYREALAEMMAVDALLVLQASNCNAQIPAKIYEYLRAGKPILGLTDPDGDTAGVLRQAGLHDIVRLDSVDEIAAVLPKLVSDWRQGIAVLPQEWAVQQASRLGRSKALVGLLAQAAAISSPLVFAAGVVSPMSFTKSLKTRVKKHVKALRRWRANTFHSFTPVDLQRALTACGLKPGDTLLAHSSFDAFEGFQGKPTDVISVLQAVVGNAGTLMMPTMTFSGTAVDHARAKPTFDVARTPSRMGLLTELFRRSPGIVRSIHPTHPVAVWGRGADAIATGHHMARTPCGEGTPFDALRQRQGAIVLLGTDINVLTFFHLLEEVLEADLPVAPFTDEVFHLQSRTRGGEILDTHCRLFEPAVSRRRNLHKMVPYLKAAGAWREAKVGGLKITILPVVAVEQVVRNMHMQGVYCYD